MKTLYRQQMTGTQASAKRKELELKTGLKLTCYSASGGVNFRPYLHKEINELYDESKIKMIMDLLPIQEGISFTAIAKKLNLEIKETLSLMQWLYNRRLISPDVSRDGKVIACHRVQ